MQGWGPELGYGFVPERTCMVAGALQFDEVSASVLE